MEFKKVYMDNSATTVVKQEVLDVMLPFFTEMYGNPSSIHHFGQISKVHVDKARMQVAELLRTRIGGNLFYCRRKRIRQLGIKSYRKKRE